MNVPTLQHALTASSSASPSLPHSITHLQVPIPHTRNGHGNEVYRVHQRPWLHAHVEDAAHRVEQQHVQQPLLQLQLLQLLIARLVQHRVAQYSSEAIGSADTVNHSLAR